MNDDNKKYVAFLGRIQEYIDSLPDENAKALARKYISQIPTNEEAQHRIKVFSSDPNLYTCAFDNNDDFHRKQFRLSASKGSAQTSISLNFNSHDNHRENEQLALNEHKKNQPDGIKRLIPSTVKKWNTKNKELLDQLYSPGTTESFAECTLRITETLNKSGQTDVVVELSDSTTDKTITPDKQDKDKKGKTAYKFVNNQLVPNEKQTGTETAL